MQLCEASELTGPHEAEWLSVLLQQLTAWLADACLKVGV